MSTNFVPISAHRSYRSRLTPCRRYLPPPGPFLDPPWLPPYRCGSQVPGAPPTHRPRSPPAQRRAQWPASEICLLVSFELLCPCVRGVVGAHCATATTVAVLHASSGNALRACSGKRDAVQPASRSSKRINVQHDAGESGRPRRSGHVRSPTATRHPRPSSAPAPTTSHSAAATASARAPACAAHRATHPARPLRIAPCRPSSARPADV